MHETSRPHATPDARALELLRAVLGQMGSAAGIINQRGDWVFTSDALLKALGQTRGTIEPVLVRKAAACILHGRTDILWLTGLETRPATDVPVRPARMKDPPGPVSAALPVKQSAIPLEEAPEPCSHAQDDNRTGNLIRFAPVRVSDEKLCLLTLHANAMNAADGLTTRDVIRTLRSQALTDPLTGLYNRRWVMDEAPALLNSASPDTPVSLMLLDLDHFKTVNDRLGHLVGDQVLQIVSARLSGLVRPPDCVCRYGGEEFLIILPGTDPETALRIAGRVRIQLAQAMDCLAGQHLTVSIGLSHVRPGESDLEPALSRADQALYAAKAAGRDCIRATVKPEKNDVDR